jgi:hypothetical protein
MFAFLNSFDWQHSVLLGGAIIGGVLVGVGILMESEKWSLAAILVLIGIAMEPIFTIGLFLYDESLGRSQQSTIEAQNREIISLQKRLAPRELGMAAQRRVADAVRAYEHPSFEVQAAVIEPGSMIVSEIIACLENAGWSIKEEPDSRIPRSASDKRATFAITDNLGVWIDFNEREGPRFSELARRLAVALMSEGVIAQDRSVPDPRLPTGTIRVLISPKP